MSKSRTDGVVAGVLYARDPWHEHSDAVADAVQTLLEGASSAASTIVVDPSTGSTPWTGPYTAHAVKDALQSAPPGVFVEGPQLRIGLELASSRPGSAPPHLYFAFEAPVVEEALIRAFEGLLGRAPILHGGVDVFGRFEDALSDVSLVPASLHDAPPELRLRWRHDAEHKARLWTRPRRLFALTVLGAAAAAADAELARAAGAVEVRSVDGGLLVQATTPLCAARDPSWRSEHAALARWLWPRTLQGPADVPVGPPPSAPETTRALSPL